MYHLTTCPSWKHYTSFIKYANVKTPSTWFVDLLGLYTF